MINLARGSVAVTVVALLVVSFYFQRKVEAVSVVAIDSQNEIQRSQNEIQNLQDQQTQDRQTQDNTRARHSTFPSKLQELFALKLFLLSLRELSLKSKRHNNRLPNEQVY